MSDDADGDLRAFRVAYDGRPYHGYQRQPDVPTVEGVLFGALADLGIGPSDDGRDRATEDRDRSGGEGSGDGEDDRRRSTDESTRRSGATRDPPPGYAAAGRTDAGVSALAQTVTARVPDWCRPRALNARLPASVRAWARADAPPEFHATHGAARRTYRYHLYAPDLDRGAVAAPLDRLEGRHDFRALSAATDDRSTVRTVSETGVARRGDHLVVRVTADGFLHEMVRRIVALVEGLARGTAPVGVDRALSGDRLAGPEGVGPAPPEPLVLAGVDYPQLDFAVDRRAVESRRAAFDERRRRASTRARVMETLVDDPGDGA